MYVLLPTTIHVLCLFLPDLVFWNSGMISFKVRCVQLVKQVFETEIVSWSMYVCSDCMFKCLPHKSTYVPDYVFVLPSPHCSIPRVRLPNEARWGQVRLSEATWGLLPFQIITFTYLSCSPQSANQLFLIQQYQNYVLKFLITFPLILMLC